MVIRIVLQLIERLCLLLILRGISRNVLVALRKNHDLNSNVQKSAVMLEEWHCLRTRAISIDRVIGYQNLVVTCAIL